MWKKIAMCSLFLSSALQAVPKSQSEKDQLCKEAEEAMENLESTFVTGDRLYCEVDTDCTSPGPDYWSVRDGINKTARAALERMWNDKGYQKQAHQAQENCMPRMRPAVMLHEPTSVSCVENKCIADYRYEIKESL